MFLFDQKVQFNERHLLSTRPKMITSSQKCFGDDLCRLLSAERPKSFKSYSSFLHNLSESHLGIPRDKPCPVFLIYSCFSFSLALTRISDANLRHVNASAMFL